MKTDFQVLNQRMRRKFGEKSTLSSSFSLCVVRCLRGLQVQSVCGQLCMTGRSAGGRSGLGPWRMLSSEAAVGIRRSPRPVSERQERALRKASGKTALKGILQGTASITMTNFT